MNKSIGKNGLSFIITDDNKIILSKGYTIKTNFRKEYLEYLEEESDKSRYNKLHKISSAKADDDVINDEYKVFKIGNPSGQSTKWKSFSIRYNYKVRRQGIHL